MESFSEYQEWTGKLSGDLGCRTLVVLKKNAISLITKKPMA